MKNIFVAAAVAATTLASQASSAPVQWAGNGHYYDLIVETTSWTSARDTAAASTFMGASGYLVTITSAAEQAFLNTLNSDSLKSWIGMTDAATEGVWEWITGEAFSYTNWNSGEPNNLGGEDYGLGWWANGDKWNDCPNVGCRQQAYIIEYEVAAVPLPAALPLAALGLGALGLMGRRRKKS